MYVSNLTPPLGSSLFLQTTQNLNLRPETVNERHTGTHSPLEIQNKRNIGFTLDFDKGVYTQIVFLGGEGVDRSYVISRTIRDLRTDLR